MTASKAKTLSTLFKTAGVKIKNVPKESPSSTPTRDKVLKHFVSSLDTSSSEPESQPPTSRTKLSPKPTWKPASRGTLRSFLAQPASPSENPLENLTMKLLSSSIVTDAPESSQDSKEIMNYSGPLGTELELDIPWGSTHKNIVTVRRKEISRERKQKHVHKNSHSGRFNRLMKMCGDKLGTTVTMNLFSKLGRETGMKEYNALIAICLAKVRTSNDEDEVLELMSEVFKTFKTMREQGFQVEEGTYGPILMYYIDMGLVDEFFFFCGPIKDGNPSSVSRLGYYEMLLWIGVNNEEKIRELCNYIAVSDEKDDLKLKENYLLALCESERKTDIMQLLEVIDITRISSVIQVANIFKALGRLSLDSFAEKFLLTLKNNDYKMDISRIIFSYVSGIPNLAVQDLFLKFKSLHKKCEIAPSSASYEKFITYCCDLRKVHFALDIVDEMCEANLELSIETLHKILHTCEECYEYNLVGRIYSLVCHHNLKANSETFRSMISLSVRMKDFNGAFAMLDHAKKLNLHLTSSIYNTIMAGYFREKNFSGALMVVKQMENEGVKPDAHTYSYVIANCGCEEEITKYFEEMRGAKVQPTKHVFMALINAYIACGLFEKAKEVLLDQQIPVNSLNEIKSALVSALASSGKMPDALNVYKEIKQNEGTLEPRAVISIIEHFTSEGELSILLQLLEELHDPDYWIEACCRSVVYCVRNRHIRSAVDLLKQLKDKIPTDDLALEAVFDEVFCVIADGQPNDLQIALALLQAMKDELGLTPSRKSLDFILASCTSAKDLQNSLLIWNEYKAAGLRYNVLTYLRMYQALLASGDHNSAKSLLTKIPKDDLHVKCIVKACQETYVQSTPTETKEKPKKKKKKKNKT